MMLPGISISTKPDDYGAFKTLRIAVFDGESWSITGDPSRLNERFAASKRTGALCAKTFLFSRLGPCPSVR